ncbi:hypothetical protein LIER_19101 [Lithospermum erythrorhizon]|uniref:Uncharacterized protein n=1 Tax=Lithospermum erythrorhizon TaxID=34254 RepID=A0AAV3QHG3_LITER
MVEFTIVDMSEGAYNGIIGQPALSQFEHVVSLIHLKIKFPTRKLEETKDRNVCTLQVLEESPKKGKPHEEIWSVPFDENNPAKVFRIDTTMGAEHEAMLIRVIREYHYIFAWEPTDMSRVDPYVAVHQLYVDPHYKPIKRKKRTFSGDKDEAIWEEVDKLLGVNAILELLFPTWLENVVIVLQSSMNSFVINTNSYISDPQMMYINLNTKICMYEYKNSYIATEDE